MGQVLNLNHEVDEQYIAKCQEYTAYIDEHVKNVKAAFYNLFRNPAKPVIKIGNLEGPKLERLLRQVEMKINVHDSSKYTPEEFDAYRRRFFPTDQEKRLDAIDPIIADAAEENFEQAWKHHCLNNDHHPIYWKWIDIQEIIEDNVVDGKPVKIRKKVHVKRTLPKETAERMSAESVLHMICDWEAMCTKFGGNVIEWYVSSAQDEQAAMYPATKKMLESILEMLYERKITGIIQQPKVGE